MPPKRKTCTRELTSSEEDYDDDEDSSARRMYISARRMARATARTRTTLLMVSDLQSLPHEALIKHILRLQTELAAAQNSTTTTATLSTAEIASKVDALRDLIVIALREHLIWTPACKTGRARFSHDFAVSSRLILAGLFERRDYGEQAWKMKKLVAEEFQNDITGMLVMRWVRHDALYLTGDVTCEWVEEEGVLRIAGFYGKIAGM